MADHATDVIEVIEAQHRQVKGLLERVAAASGAGLEESFCDLRRTIVVHETAEEEVVYPVLRLSGGEGQRLAAVRAAEEREGTELLTRLEKVQLGSAEFSALFEQFRTAVLDHAAVEEATVVPLLRSTQSRDTLHRMASAFELAERVAPAHAHPQTGTSAASHVVTGPAIAMIDRVRGALRKN